MPLAGKPPFATDEPDSYYESDKLKPPQRRQRQPNPPNPNDRTSNYDVYDSYFDEDGAANRQSTNRQSGAGALGLGFLNGSMDDEDSDEEDYKPMPKKSIENPNPFASKHDALAAATAADAKKERQPSPKPIAAPQPGYAAPIAALNLAKPEPTMPPSHPSQRRPNANVNNLQVAADRSVPGQQQPMPSPLSPHPAQGPVSPITPAFARPRPPKAEVTFAEGEKAGIMRGGTEGTTIPRRGDKGDDFWRRFSMVAREDRSGNKTSPWLRKAQNGSNRLSRWVWIIGLILALAIAGGIGIGWYVSHKAPDHQQPTAFGGSAGEKSSPSSSSIKAIGSGKASVRSSFLVQPTHTVQRRYAPAEVTALAREYHVARRH